MIHNRMQKINIHKPYFTSHSTGNFQAIISLIHTCLQTVKWDTTGINESPYPQVVWSPPPIDPSNHLPLFIWPNSSTLTPIIPFSKMDAACSYRIGIHMKLQRSQPKDHKQNKHCRISLSFPYIQYNTAVMLTHGTKLRHTLYWGQVMQCSSFIRSSSASNRMGPVIEYMVICWMGLRKLTG
jgi:hypothetical protein